MYKLIPTLTLMLGTMLMLTAGSRAAAADETTVSPFCRTFPARCSRESPPVVKASPEDEHCAELGKHPAIIRREKKAWKTPLGADGEATLHLWDTTCRDWQKRHHRWEPDGEEKARAWSTIERERSDAAWERSESRYRNRINCISTWDHYPYSSRLTTTCTSY